VFEEETSGTIVIPDTDDDMDEDSTGDIPTDDSSEDSMDSEDSVPSDILNSCSLPSMVILLAMLGGFVGLRFENRNG
jgi:hypothetical protein